MLIVTIIFAVGIALAMGYRSYDLALAWGIVLIGLWVNSIRAAKRKS